MRLNGPVADTRRSRAIAADPQKIWDVLADFGAISSWADAVDHSCLLDHGTAGGTVGTSRRVQLGRTTLVERITDFDPPHTLAYDVEDSPLVRRLHNSWTLRPIARGLTEVTLTSAVTVGSIRCNGLPNSIGSRVRQPARPSTRLPGRRIEGHCVRNA